MRAVLDAHRHGGVGFITVAHLLLSFIYCWFLSPSIIQIAAEEPRYQASSSSSRPIEVKAASRPFEPGVLYDAVNEKVLSSFRLWPEDENTISIKTTPQKSINSQMYTSDSLEAKSEMLDVGGELKLSILSGLIEVGGSAKYLNEKKASSKYASVSFVISERTKHDYYRFPAIRANMSISAQALHDASLATHLVTGVTYGGKAVFEFQLEDREDMSRTEITRSFKGELSNMLSSIVSGELSVEGKVNNAELKRFSSVRCNFFGDFTLDNVPSTLGEAVAIMKDIPRLIEEARTPISAMLVPIQHFTGTRVQRFARQIGVELVENAVGHFGELSTIQLHIEELLAKAEDSKLSDLLRLMTNFHRIISGQKTRVEDHIAKKLPKIRGTGQGAEALTDYLASSESCLLHGGADELMDSTIAVSAWLEAQESILKITNLWLQALNESGSTLALRRADINIGVAGQQQEKCSLVILLPTVAVKPPYLKQLSHCFSGAGASSKHPAMSRGSAADLTTISMQHQPAAPDASSSFGNISNTPCTMSNILRHCSIMLEESESVRQLKPEILLATSWADINSKLFSVGQKEVLSFARFLTLNRDVLQGRVFIGMQQSPISSRRAQQLILMHQLMQQTPTNVNAPAADEAAGQHRHDHHHHHQQQAMSLLQTKVYCSGETPTQFGIPQPPRNINIDSCNVTDDDAGGPICITIQWDEPAAAAASPAATAVGYLMRWRCRRTLGRVLMPNAATLEADLKIFPWIENIPARQNMSLNHNNPCVHDKADSLFAAHRSQQATSADQLLDEYEIQIQTVTKSMGRSDWSNSVFHQIKDDRIPKYANQEDVQLTKLMVVGGFDGISSSGVYHVEVINLTSGKSLTCPVPPLRDGPLNFGAVGAFIAGNGIDKAVVCAGYNAQNKCYTYSNMTDTWDAMPGTLIHSLHARAAVVLGDGRWWLTGGCCPISNQTEILEFKAGPDAIRSQAFVPLPRPANGHHMLLLNESAVVFVGGETQSDNLWLFNVHTSKWTQLPSMPRARANLVAGLARFGNEGNQQQQQWQLVVTGGGRDTSTIIFDFDSNKWRNGRNNFPHHITYAASVQYKDTFLVVGGLDSNYGKRLDTIYEFDATNEKWVQTSKKLLRGGKNSLAAFLVPDSYVQQPCAG